MNSMALASKAYAFAEEHYGDKDARFDVIVECMTVPEIAAEFDETGIATEEGAIAWAKRRAGLHHEQELNQAWDGPESVKSSSQYDPAHDPAAPLQSDACPACGKESCEGNCPEMDEAMRPDFIEHIDGYTGCPHYTVNSQRAAEQFAQDFGCNQLLRGEIE